MNKTNRSADKVGFILSSALVLALAGCTTYVERPSRTVYVPPAPPMVVVPPAEPPVVVIHNENDFYEPLSPHGEWVVVGSYGRCWRPTRVTVGWRPYCDGHWRRTDAGWYWVSDEPWGWATYHYGRWDWSVGFGWVWVPHTQWAPAWVAWRHGGGYVGWAPLPPSARFGARGVLEVREPTSPPRAFVFVSEQRLMEPVRPTTVIVNNTTIINKTVNITKVEVVNQTVINEGPRPEVIERRSGRKVQSIPVRELRHKEETEVVARQRNEPSRTERREQPSVATESAPARTASPRESGRPEKAPETVQRPQPPAKRNEIREVEQPKSAGKPVRPEREIPGRNERKPETKIERVERATPADATPKGRPEAKPGTAIPPRETRPVEKPPEAVTQPQPAANRNEAREGGQPKSPGKPARPEGQRPAGNERHRELERGKGKPDTAQPVPARKPTPPPSTNQVERRKAPSKPAAVKPGDARKKKDDKKKDEDQESQQPAAPPKSPQ